MKRTCFPLKAAWAVHLIGLTWYGMELVLIRRPPSLLYVVCDVMCAHIIKPRGRERRG